MKWKLCGIWTWMGFAYALYHPIFWKSILWASIICGPCQYSTQILASLDFRELCLWLVLSNSSSIIFFSTQTLYLKVRLPCQVSLNTLNSGRVVINLRNEVSVLILALNFAARIRISEAFFHPHHWHSGLQQSGKKVLPLFGTLLPIMQCAWARAPIGTKNWQV